MKPFNTKSIIVVVGIDVNADFLSLSLEFDDLYLISQTSD